jgi:hypothetical protein
MTLRDLLLRSYPRAWRDEYGPELGGILAHKRLTPALIADILASSARQHLRRDPWKSCSLCLALWTAGLLLVAGKGLVTYPEFLGGYIAGQLFLFAAGAWTVLRENSGIRGATAASVKAALVPDAVCILVSSVNILRYWGASTALYGHSVYYWISKNFVITVFVSVVFGLAGASLARLVSRFRRFAQ